MELSKYYKNGRHAGWKKFVHGRSIHLITGTSSQNYLFAIKFAEALLKRGEQLKASGENWDDSIIQAVKASVDLPSAKIAERETPLVPPSVQAVATSASPSASSDLYAVIEQYKKAERLRASSRKITDDHCRNQCEHIETAKQGLRDIPMSAITLHDLKTWTGHWTSRPTGKRGRQVSASYAASICTTVRHFLDWADAEGHWMAVRRWTDAFKGTSEGALTTPRERKKIAKGFPNFTIQECQTIWDRAWFDDTRLFLGLGLFCGFTQKEIATLCIDDITEENGEVYIERCRHKSSVYGRWWVPHEVAQLLKMEIEHTKEKWVNQNLEGLAILTRNGKPLVHATRSRKSKSDAVRSQWSKLLPTLARYGVRQLSFKFLRKTMSQCVRNLLGREFAQMFAAQTQDTVQDESYSRGNFAKLERCIREEIYPKWRVIFTEPDLDQIKAAVNVETASKLTTEAA